MMVSLCLPAEIRPNNDQNTKLLYKQYQHVSFTSQPACILLAMFR